MWVCSRRLALASTLIPTNLAAKVAASYIFVQENNACVSIAVTFDLLVDGPSDAAMTIALAHGAGAAMDMPFMAFFATQLADRGFRVVRFEFPYMAEYRKTGKGKPPDREPVLRETWLRVVEQVGRKGLVIGGKSMGGRIASLIADEAGVAGLVCLGYPFHPVGKSEQLRVKHLQSIKTRTLILQGERDPFGNREEVAKYKLSRAVTIKWLVDGDHSFKPRKSSGRTEQQTWEEAVERIVAFVGSC
jgi:predicted alpha/beta-hydrolase family hydrolase